MTQRASWSKLYGTDNSTQSRAAIRNGPQKYHRSLLWDRASNTTQYPAVKSTTDRLLCYLQEGKTFWVSTWRQSYTFEHASDGKFQIPHRTWTQRYKKLAFKETTVIRKGNAGLQTPQLCAPTLWNVELVDLTVSIYFAFLFLVLATTGRALFRSAKVGMYDSIFS